MEKKNPFVTTIGFKKDDPDHVYVAELLNSLGRGKAQYIVKAILAYQSNPGNDGISQTTSLDYTAVRRIVLQVLEEQRNAHVMEEPVIKQNIIPEEEPENNFLEDFDEDALDGIMAAMAAFQDE